MTGSDRQKLLGLADFLRGLAPFEEVFPISAARGFGVGDLREYLLSRCGAGPPPPVARACLCGCLRQGFRIRI